MIFPGTQSGNSLGEIRVLICLSSFGISESIFLYLVPLSEWRNKMLYIGQALDTGPLVLCPGLFIAAKLRLNGAVLSGAIALTQPRRAPRRAVSPLLRPRDYDSSDVARCVPPGAACSTLDARTPSASPDQQRGMGPLVPLSSPCNTLTDVPDAGGRPSHQRYAKLLDTLFLELL